jgi:hypothetical protein
VQAARTSRFRLVNFRLGFDDGASGVGSARA